MCGVFSVQRTETLNNNLFITNSTVLLKTALKCLRSWHFDYTVLQIDQAKKTFSHKSWPGTFSGTSSCSASWKQVRKNSAVKIDSFCIAGGSV